VREGVDVGVGVGVGLGLEFGGPFFFLSLYLWSTYPAGRMDGWIDGWTDRWRARERDIFRQGTQRKDGMTDRFDPEGGGEGRETQTNAVDTTSRGLDA